MEGTCRSDRKSVSGLWLANAEEHPHSTRHPSGRRSHQAYRAIAKLKFCAKFGNYGAKGATDESVWPSSACPGSSANASSPAGLVNDGVEFR